MRLQDLFLLLSLMASSVYGQSSFTIELNAPAFINDSLIFSPPRSRTGLDVHRFTLDTNGRVGCFGKDFGFNSTYVIRVQERNILHGEADYPQPVSFQYVNERTGRGYKSATFFLEPGQYAISLPAHLDSFQVKLNSPANKEYGDFLRSFAGINDAAKRKKKLVEYIKAHPRSYVALWEMVEHCPAEYDSSYSETLDLFSDQVKSTQVYKALIHTIGSEAAILGAAFPTIHFDSTTRLTKADFQKYKLTFIEYWATYCAPCIQAMPEIVGMYHDYKERGIGFITVTADREPQRMAAARRILAANKVTWTNYFDIDQDFDRKVAANGYPLYFLVDGNGVVVARLRDLSAAKKIIRERLSKQ